MWLKKLRCKWFGHKPGNSIILLFGSGNLFGKTKCKRCGVLLNKPPVSIQKAIEKPLAEDKDGVNLTFKVGRSFKPMPYCGVVPQSEGLSTTHMYTDECMHPADYDTMPDEDLQRLYRAAITGEYYEQAKELVEVAKQRGLTLTQE